MRRVVAVQGDTAGRIVSDGPISNSVTWFGGIVLNEVWSTSTSPPPFDPVEPQTGLRNRLSPGATRWMIVEYPPSSDNAQGRPVLHKTNSVDYFVVLSGTVDMILDDGSVTKLTPGDCVVQLGAAHAWRNSSSDPCVISVVTLGNDGESANYGEIDA